ncbi:hypothetical protein EVAR_39843_1 [Eumeta japonica]|uniref:Uncharacterized protein n=1 Tax=Eumeta variegata TaxID=151549 RepID=A0A4C1WTN1_EUMVA|nr:hypothetical protein EVAR_39843_1 [Eumeta japonica]
MKRCFRRQTGISRNVRCLPLEAEAARAKRRVAVQPLTYTWNLFVKSCFGTRPTDAAAEGCILPSERSARNTVAGRCSMMFGCVARNFHGPAIVLIRTVFNVSHDALECAVSTVLKTFSDALMDGFCRVAQSRDSSHPILNMNIGRGDLSRAHLLRRSESLRSFSCPCARRVPSDAASSGDNAPAVFSTRFTHKCILGIDSIDSCVPRPADAAQHTTCCTGRRGAARRSGAVMKTKHAFVMTQCDSQEHNADEYAKVTNVDGRLAKSQSREHDDKNKYISEFYV